MSGLLEFLRARTNDRGVLADLRGALVESKRHRAWPILAGFGGVGDDWRAQCVQTVAGLYALHPKEASVGDIGTTCRTLLSDDERTKLYETREVGPLSRRFQHLLAADGEEVFGRVTRLVMRAKSEDIPVNYAQLLQDLTDWQYKPESVRVRWAKSFWVPQVEEQS
jgi:CRISPR system Cascade subunit CasB